MDAEGIEEEDPMNSWIPRYNMDVQENAYTDASHKVQVDIKTIKEFRYAKRLSTLPRIRFEGKHDHPSDEEKKLKLDAPAYKGCESGEMVYVVVVR